MQPSTSDIFGSSMDGYSSFDAEKEVVLRLEYISAAEAKACCMPMPAVAAPVKTHAATGYI